jgi:hypothetical protein
MVSAPLKLNLGSGQRPLPGYINVDKCGSPDILHDLEMFPWPWQDSCTEEVLMTHVLEHLGATTATFLGIIRELYRICKNNALVHIAVPHPRHDDFIGDPTHVRALTAESFELFSKEKNRQWKDAYANSPLGLYCDVDFEITHINYIPDPLWTEKLNRKECSPEQFSLAARTYNNVIQQIQITLKVIK